MYRISLSSLSELLGVHFDACVSVYLPLDNKALQSSARSAAFRRLRKEALTVLETSSKGTSSSRITRSLMEFEKTLERNPFPNARGMAVFVHRDFAGYMPLREACESSVTVANSFHLKPLFPLLDASNTWSLLDIADDNSRLFSCRAGEAEETGIHMAGLKRLRGVLQGANTTDAPAFGLLRRVKQDVSGSVPARLVIRAPEAYHAGLRTMAHRFGLLTTFLNRPSSSKEDFHNSGFVQEGWQSIRTGLEAGKFAMLRFLQNEYYRGKALTDPSEVVRRIRSGNLQTLVFREDLKQRGEIDWEEGRVVFLNENRKQSFGDCVIDDIAERALRAHAQVYSAPSRQMPLGTSLIAI
jgi:hypothetical protein